MEPIAAGRSILLREHDGDDRLPRVAGAADGGELDRLRAAPAPRLRRLPSRVGRLLGRGTRAARLLLLLEEDELPVEVVQEENAGLPVVADDDRADVLPALRPGLILVLPLHVVRLHRFSLSLWCGSSPLLLPQEAARGVIGRP